MYCAATDSRSQNWHWLFSGGPAGAQPPEAVDLPCILAPGSCSAYIRKDAQGCLSAAMLHNLHRCVGHVSGASCSTDNTQQQQKQQPHAGGPNISLLSEDLQGQWHKELNVHLGNILIRPGSHRKVWWSCDECPDGLPHIWEAAVKNRTHGTGCPFCSGNAACQHNTVASRAPAVALLWDAKKNHPLSPAQVTVYSRKRVLWKCNVCHYESQAPVQTKVCVNSACPQCAKANVGTRQKHTTFAAARHALLDQWHHDQNKAVGIFPNNTTLKSSKLVW